MATEEQKQAMRERAKPMKPQMSYADCMGSTEPFGSPECPLDYHDFITEFQSYITINGWDDHYKFIIYQYLARLHTKHRRILTSDLTTHLKATGNPDSLYDIGSDDWFQAWELIYNWFLVQMRTTIRGSKEFELSNLTKQYEQFKFEEDETVLQAHSRFMAIINDIHNCDPNSHISTAIRLRKLKQALPTELRHATILADHNPLYQINPLDSISDQEQIFTNYLKLLNDTQTHLFQNIQQVVQQRNHTRVNAIQNNNPGTFTVNKPCRYFLTPRGCIKGDDCTYLHVADLKSWMQQNKDRWTAIPEPYRKTLIETYNNTQLALKNQNSQKTNNIHVSHLSTAENNALAAMNDTTYQHELNMLNPPTSTPDPIVQSLTTENEQLRSQLHTYATQQEILINKFESLSSKLDTIATPFPALAAAEPVEPPKRKVLDLTRPRDRSNE